MIVCLVSERRDDRRLDPRRANGRMAVARKGEGVWLDGKRVVKGTPKAVPTAWSQPHPQGVRRQLSPRSAAGWGELTTMKLRGREYIEVLAGQTDFTSTA